jgi:diacylglycerol kinase family enzyme
VRRVVIIANAGAGSFSQQRFDAICTDLEASGMTLQRCFCSDFTEMTEKAAELSRPKESPTIVAAGGDGTINAVFNGLAGNSATCAILPMGTANVMALELGINSVEVAASRICNDLPHSFTAGLLQNSQKSSRFFLMAGIGYDGHIVRGVSLKKKKLLGKSAYLFSALQSLVNWDAGELTVTTEQEEFRCGSLIICNASRYGGSFVLAPSATVFSSRFEIFAIKGSSRSSTIEAVIKTALGRSDPAQLYRTTASRISVAGLKPVQADGDNWGDAPLEIVAEPDYAKMLF